MVRRDVVRYAVDWLEHRYSWQTTEQWLLDRTRPTLHVHVPCFDECSICDSWQTAEQWLWCYFLGAWTELRWVSYSSRLVWCASTNRLSLAVVSFPEFWNQRSRGGEKCRPFLTFFYFSWPNFLKPKCQRVQVVVVPRKYVFNVYPLDTSWTEFWTNEEFFFTEMSNRERNSDAT